VIDEPAKNLYPQPLFMAEQDDCAVGRLRRDCALENGLAFWVSGDQLLKGAALNAVQIAEELLKLPTGKISSRKQAAPALTA
jgi:aspartate-semialdehyde dehydrogenase